MKPKVAVIDTKAGNLFSIFAALKRLNIDPVLISNSSDFDSESQAFNALLIPGQGRFGQVMKNLTSAGLDKVICDWYLAGKNILAICVGMQIFFEESEEDPGVAGLGLLSGKVEKLKIPKRPMVGWCDLISKQATLHQKSVYFVNGYGITKTEYATAYVDYGEGFVASIGSKGLNAFQFHPEKSAKVGHEILQQCLV